MADGLVMRQDRITYRGAMGSRSQRSHHRGLAARPLGASAEVDMVVRLRHT
jgi:hypothetical protein